MAAQTAIRQHLARALEWPEAHVTFEKAVAGIQRRQRGLRPKGFEHSAWQLLEHLRIAQDDLLDFCVNRTYVHALKWPEDYWPASAAPPSDQAWDDSIAAYQRSRRKLQRLARTVKNLTAPVPTGKKTQTYLRTVLLLVDHNAYHLGQLIAVRRALGIWN
jgi:uncharacterized damage-inducible protein DinB